MTTVKTLFTLPEGWRPPYKMMIAVADDSRETVVRSHLIAICTSNPMVKSMPSITWRWKMTEVHGIHAECPTCMCGVLGPEDFSCKKCGQPVRYGNNNGYGMAFEARPILSGPYLLEEEVIDGVATGNWISTYVRVADRVHTRLGFRKHDCKAKRS
jgi:hypothetical protein